MVLLKDKWEREVFLSLGSNEGNGIENLFEARKLISNKAGKLLNASSVYITEPWGNDELNVFYNQVVQISTKHNPLILLDICQRIEKVMGRKEKITLNYENRTIDIDMLFYGSELLKKNRLLLPHPHIAKRNFVLKPLAEIAGSFIHPVLKRSIDELLRLSKDNKKVKKLV